MVDLRKVTLSVEVSIAEAMKNLQLVKTQFQSLDELSTKSLSSSLDSSTKSLKNLETQLKSSSIKDFDTNLNVAQSDLKDLGYTGVQSGGIISNALKNAEDSVGKFIKGLGGIRGTLGVLGVGALVGSTVLAASSAQLDKMGAMQVAQQRGWQDEELANLDAFLEKRNEYVSKADLYLFAERNASFASNTNEIASSLDNETTLFANNIGRLRDKGIHSINDLDAAIKSGDKTVLEGIVNISPTAETNKIRQKAQAAALKETGGFTAAGYKEAQDKYTVYYEYQEEIAKSTEGMSMKSNSAAAAMMELNASLADLQVTIGTNLLPTFTALINSLTWFIDLLGPGLSSVLAVSAGIVGIATALAYVLGPLRAVTILLSSNPLGIVVVALGIILPLLYDYANRMGYIQKAMDWLNSLDIEKKLSGLGEFALKVILPKAEFLSPMILLLKFLYNESGTISAIVVKIYDLLRNFVEWVLTGIAGIIKWIQDIPTRLTELKDAIVTSILSIPEKIVSTLKNLKDAIYKFLGIETPEETKQKQDDLYEASLAKGFSEREAHQIAYPKDKYFYMPGEAAHPLSELGITEEEAKKQGMLQEIKTFDEQQEKEIARLKGEHYKPERSAVESLASAPGEALITTGAQVEKYGQASVTKFLTPVNQKFHEKVEEKSKLPGIIGSIIRSDWEVATNPAAAATGGYIKSDGLIKLHAGERVLSESDVQRGGSAGGDITVNLTINNPLFTNSSEMYKFDQHIRDIINRENLCHMTNKRGRGMIV
jgi:hypothetical protein